VVSASQRTLLIGLLASMLVIALATGFSWAILGREVLADVVMVYLLGIVVVAMRFGYVPSLAAAVMSVLVFNFFFIPPYYTFIVADGRHLVTFVVMAVVAFVISSLTKRLRDQAEARARLAEEAHKAKLETEAERVRSSLLSSLSHDLKTPLAVVTGAATTLLDESVAPSARRDLTETIAEEAERLNRLVQNLLDMTRIQSGAVRVKKQWQPVEEVVGVALGRMEKALGDREVTTSLPEDLPLVPLDSVLIEQVLVNLLDNAAKHTPPQTPILVAARAVDGGVEIEIADRGPGIPAGEETRIFEKFHRVKHEGAGAGLGLAICSGIVAAHGGKITSSTREGGGASFRFVLPIEGTPPDSFEELEKEHAA
jgi:two-component system, OmpR family, sensor histidine kinase KdpD